MDGCLRCSGRAVPYGGGGVTPITLTPNFEFPITSSDLNGKTMTASSPITLNDLVDGFKFIDTDENEWGIQLEGGEYIISDGVDVQDVVSLSSDGITISFTSRYAVTIPTFARFTFNA